MRLSSTENVDKILVTIDALRRLSSQVLEHTESVRERVNMARWELYLRAKQQAGEETEAVTSSLPQDVTELEELPHVSCSDAFVDTIVNARTCVCDQEDSGLMIMCNGTKCPYEWFHVECVGLQDVPDGDWLCPFCRD